MSLAFREPKLLSLSRPSRKGDDPLSERAHPVKQMAVLALQSLGEVVGVEAFT